MINVCLTRPTESLIYNVSKIARWERDPLILTCQATNGYWRFCRWAKTGVGSCTYEYVFKSNQKWSQDKCEIDPKCRTCDSTFTEFELIAHEMPASEVNKSFVVGKSTLCQIKKMRAELGKDDGEYTCSLLKCSEPHEGGCKHTTEEFGKVTSKKINVKVA